MRRPPRNTGAVFFRALAAITAFIAIPFFFAGPLAAARGDAALTPAPSASVSVFASAPGWPKLRSSAVTTEIVGPGVTYERWTLSTDAGPLVVSLATVDLHNPFVSFGVVTHNDVIVGKGERLTSMGDRIGAEVGINADYFDINDTGSPLNLVAAGQRILHQPDRAAAFVVDSAGAIHMGPVNWRAKLASASGAARDIFLVNEWSPSVDLALLTPEFGVTSGGGATELVLSPANSPEQYRIDRIDTHLSLLDMLAANQLGVAARGTAADTLARDFQTGDTVTLTQQGDAVLAGVRLGVGGGPLLVKDGAAMIDPAAPAVEETNVRNPVTGAGISTDGTTLWLVVVDGRKPAISIGLTRPQLAAFFLSLGARNAMAFDSGGSSEMVIRHEGDPASSVANTPSDGRERGIADGLFVVNVAPKGAVAKLLLKAPSSAVLVGSKLGIDVRAVDANEQPIPVKVSDVAFAAEPASSAIIDANGTVTALAAGSVRVSAAVGGVQTSAAIRVVASIDELKILPEQPKVTAGGTLHLSAAARTKEGEAIAVDPSAVSWSQSISSRRVLSDGTFIAPRSPAATVVSANAGGASASTTVLSGDHPMLLQARPKPGPGAGAWRYVSRPAGLPGGVDGSAAPDGSQALRLTYDFSTTEATRAAYAQTEIICPGQPLALAVDVFGDGNMEWLRGGYRNADGNDESLTIARRVDWQGWRTIRLDIPAQAAWPIVWTRFYVVERSKDAREQGSLWFRNFKLFYPGP